MQWEVDFMGVVYFVIAREALASEVGCDEIIRSRSGRGSRLRQKFRRP